MFFKFNVDYSVNITFSVLECLNNCMYYVLYNCMYCILNNYLKAITNEAVRMEPSFFFVPVLLALLFVETVAVGALESVSGTPSAVCLANASTLRMPIA